MAVIQYRTDYPRGGSTLADILSNVGVALSNLERRRLIEQERKRREEETAFSRDVQLRQILAEEAALPIPGARPTAPEAGVVPVGVRKFEGEMAPSVPGAPTAPSPVETRAIGEMTAPAPAPVQEEVIPGLTFRGKQVLPERRVPRLYESEVRERALRDARLRSGWVEAPEDISVGRFHFKKGELVPPQVAAQAAKAQEQPTSISFPDDPRVPTVLRGQSFKPGDPMYEIASQAAPEYAKSLFAKPTAGPAGSWEKEYDEKGQLVGYRNLTTNQFRPVKEGVFGPSGRKGLETNPFLQGADFSLTGEDFLKTLPPEVRGAVKKVAFNEVPASVAGRGKEMREAIIQAAPMVNPNWSQVSYEEAKRTATEYAGGMTHRNIVAINTLSHHLIPFSEAAEALGTGDVQKINQLRNYFRKNFGVENISNFNTLQKLVSDEIANVFKTTGATDAAIKNASQAIYSSQSPQQLLGSIKQLSRLAEGRIDALGDKYDVYFGEGAFEKKGMVSKKAMNSYRRISGAERLGEIGEEEEAGTGFDPGGLGLTPGGAGQGPSLEF